jgi:hypothetical protein
VSLAIEAPTSLEQYEAARDWFVREIGPEKYQNARREAREAAPRVADQVEWEVFRWLLRAIAWAEARGSSIREFRSHVGLAVRAVFEADPQAQLAGAKRTNAKATKKSGTKSTSPNASGGGTGYRAKTSDKPQRAIEAEVAQQPKYAPVRMRDVVGSLRLSEHKSPDAKKSAREALAKCAVWRIEHRGAGTCQLCLDAKDFVCESRAWIWKVLAPPLHRRPRLCDCSLQCSNAKSVAELAASNSPELGPALQQLAKGVQVAMDVAEANGVRFIQAPDGTWLPTSKTARGPCLSVAINKKTGKIAFDVNHGLKPKFGASVRCFMDRIDAAIRYTVALYKGWAHPKTGNRRMRGAPGLHAEVYAVGRVIENCDEMADVVVCSVRLQNPDGSKATKRGELMRRCVNCFGILNHGEHAKHCAEQYEPLLHSGDGPPFVPGDHYCGPTVVSDHKHRPPRSTGPATATKASTPSAKTPARRKKSKPARKK